jgi:hypothetical protein
MPYYLVHESPDHPTRLLELLNAQAKAGGRVISVTWQPARTTEDSGRPLQHAGGFTVVTEHEL